MRTAADEPVRKCDSGRCARYGSNSAAYLARAPPHRRAVSRGSMLIATMVIASGLKRQRIERIGDRLCNVTPHSEVQRRYSSTRITG